MSTNAQILANQNNARLSTGPKTPEGKASSARNATRHGLTATFTVLPHESQDDFDQLLASYRSEFSPDGEHENFLVDQMAQSRWKLIRIQRLENAAFDQILNEANPDDPDARIVAALSSNGNALDKLQRYAAAAERSYHTAHRELMRLGSFRDRAKMEALDALHARFNLPPFPPLPNEANWEPAIKPTTYNDPVRFKSLRSESALTTGVRASSRQPETL